MSRRITILVLSALMATPVFAQQNVHQSLALHLDELAALHYEDHLQLAFGTFTFEYTALATPFSRWLEDALIRAVPETKSIRLFNRSAAAAMDSSFRELYADFFASNQVDALLSGHYFVEHDGIRIRMDLTSLRNGNLIGSTEFHLGVAQVPRSIEVVPSVSATLASQTLSNIFDSTPGSNTLQISLSTERGSGAAYRGGEDLSVTVMVDRDAYVKLYHIDSNGQTQLIWPNRFGGGDGRITARTLLTIPGSTDPFRFRLGPPYGTEFIKAVASTEAFTAKETDFLDLGTDARDVIIRGSSDSAAGRQREKAEALVSYVIME